MVAGFLAGVWLLTHSPTVPDACFVQLLPIGLILLACRSPATLLAALGCGFLWATLHAHIRLSERLPSGLEGRELLVEGTVADVPQRDRRAIRFLMKVERVVKGGASWRGLARLSWYRPGAPPRSGQRLRLWVRLARPRGFVNPGGFDYEGWLFARGITATGYVRRGPDSGHLDGTRVSLDGLRQLLVERMSSALPSARHRGLLQAIALGVRGDVTPAQWEVLRATGTAHLMAISGLHIGLVAGIVFLAARKLWTLCGRCVRRMPAGPPAAVAAMAAAVAYSALAGFSVPTQRALVMASVAMVSLATRRSSFPSVCLAIALLVVLLLDPMAVVSAGFWLSFGAVAAILYGVVGYGAEAEPGGRGARLWWRWVRVHWLLGVALVPMTLLYFGRFAWLSPVANLVAVPWVGFTVVPFALLGTLLLAVHPPLGAALLQVASLSLDLVWPLLERAAALQAYVHAAGPTGGLTLAVGVVGAVLLLMPRGLPARMAGIAWLLPLLWPSTDRPAPGELWITVLDVGQGLAVVARTHGHVLVYDAGPRFSERFDAGSAVVIPYLRQRGIRKIDMLVVSHGDNDHAGGAEALLTHGLVDRLLANRHVGPLRAVPCRTGRQWRWDAVEFTVLHPGSRGPARGNDASCVLQITAADTRILFPGDVERAGEQALVARHGESLASSILLLPHHGSDTSSTPLFLDAVRPCVALLSRGHRNRFGFPDPRVLQRLAERGTPWLDTAVHGAIEARFASDGRVKSLRLARLDDRRIWHRLGADAPGQGAIWLEGLAPGPHCPRPSRDGDSGASAEIAAEVG